LENGALKTIWTLGTQSLRKEAGQDCARIMLSGATCYGFSWEIISYIGISFLTLSQINPVHTTPYYFSSTSILSTNLHLGLPSLFYFLRYYNFILRKFWPSQLSFSISLHSYQIFSVIVVFVILVFKV
jgi:hypothetical protein